MAEAGVTREHLAKVLNHIEGGAAAMRVYDRYNYDAEKRQALDAWARSLKAILENERGRQKVLAFQRSQEKIREGALALAPASRDFVNRAAVCFAAARRSRGQWKRGERPPLFREALTRKAPLTGSLPLFPVTARWTTVFVSTWQN